MRVAVAVFDCVGDDEQELSFKAGDILIDVIPADEEGDDWFQGRIKGSNVTGLFPGNYVQFQEEETSPPPLPPREPSKMVTTPTIHPDGTVYPRPLIPDENFHTIVKQDPKEIIYATRMALLEKSNAFIRTGRERAASSSSSSRDSSTSSRKIQPSASFPETQSHHLHPHHHHAHSVNGSLSRKTSNDSISTTSSTAASPRSAPRRMNSHDSNMLNSSNTPAFSSLPPPKTPPRPVEPVVAKRPPLLLANQHLEPPAMPPRPDTPPSHTLSPSLTKTKPFFSPTPSFSPAPTTTSSLNRPRASSDVRPATPPSRPSHDEPSPPSWASPTGSIKPSQLKTTQPDPQPSWVLNPKPSALKPSPSEDFRASITTPMKSIQEGETVLKPSQIFRKPSVVSDPRPSLSKPSTTPSLISQHGLASTGKPKPWELEAQQLDSDEDTPLTSTASLDRKPRYPPLTDALPKAAPSSPFAVAVVKKPAPPPPPASKPVEMKARPVSMIAATKKPPPPPPPSKGSRMSTMQRKAPPPPPTKKAALACPIPKDAKRWYDDAFERFDGDGDGFMTGTEVRSVWLRSRLDSMSLGLIWLLVDSRRRMKLDREEFCAGMHLIDERLKGREVPTQLPVELERYLDAVHNQRR